MKIICQVCGKEKDFAPAFEPCREGFVCRKQECLSHLSWDDDREEYFIDKDKQ